MVPWATIPSHAASLVGSLVAYQAASEEASFPPGIEIQPPEN